MHRFTFILLFLASAVQGQHVMKFRVAVGGGSAPAWSYGEPSSSSNLVVLFAEPSLRFTSRSIGVRGELALFQSASLGIVGQQYLFGHKWLKPYVGLGAAMYSSQRSSDIGKYTPDHPTNFGFFPRIGIDLTNRFTICADYNIVPSTSATLTTNVSVSHLTMFNNYMAIKVGIIIGSRMK